MNDQYNISPESEEVVDGRGPSVITQLIFAVIGGCAGALIPELGFFSIFLMAACVIYTVSSRASMPLCLIPAVGAAVVVIRSGVVLGGLAVLVLVSAYMAGYVLRCGGSFIPALLRPTLLSLAVVTLVAAWLMKANGITVEMLYDAVGERFRAAVEESVALLGDQIPKDTAALLIGQAETFAGSMIVYAPAAVAVMIELVGICAIRAAGLLHDITGSTVYREKQRFAVVNRAFAVVYLAGLAIGLFGGGVVGGCAANVAMVMLLPASAAGVTYGRQRLRTLRSAGRRGFATYLTVAFVVMLVMSPVAALMGLSFFGVMSAFSKKREKTE